MKKVRWGIAGPGFIAHKFAEAVENVEIAQLTSVASKDFDKAQKFADKYNILHVYGCYEEMAKSDSIDAVYISTAHPFHVDCAEIFIKNKKHILCEKPLCVNADEAKYLQKLADENGVFLMEAMWTGFLPFVRLAKDIISAGKIGDIRKIEAGFCYSIEPEEDPKLFQNSLAGGSLLDVGVYGLYFANLFADSEPESITSVCNVKNDVDLHTEILIKYRSGIIASVSSAINTKGSEDATIYGTKGKITIPTFYCGEKFCISNDDGVETVYAPYVGNGFEEEIIHSSECILRGILESNVHPVDTSVKILEIMDSVRAQNSIRYPMDK